MKKEEKSSNFFTFTFYVKFIYFVRKHIWKSLVHTITFILQLF